MNLDQETRRLSETGFDELAESTVLGRVVGYISDGSLRGYRWVLSNVEPVGDCDGTSLSEALAKMFPEGGCIRPNRARATADFRYAVEDAVAAIQSSSMN